MPAVPVARSASDSTASSSPATQRKKAKDVLKEIIEKANRPAVEGFRSAVQQAGNSTSDKRGMWADSTFEDLVQTTTDSAGN